MKVLVVEDEAIIAWDIEAIVLEAGYNVVGLARTTEEALSLAPQADVALVDVRLADGMTGPDIAQALVEKHGLAVVFMTGNPESVIGSLRGALGVMSKPHSPEKVMDALRLAGNWLQNQLGDRSPSRSGHQNGLASS